MLWSPNVWSGAVDDPTQGYVPYWPGESCASRSPPIDPFSLTSFPPLDVDIAGLSFYSLGSNQSINQAPASNLFKSLFTPFYNLLDPPSLASPSQNLLNLTSPIPVIISETSAPFFYSLSPTSLYFNQTGNTDIAAPLPNVSTLSPSLASPPYPNSEDELFIKASWFVQLTSNETSTLFPRLVAVCWFEQFKRGGAGRGSRPFWPILF